MKNLNIILLFCLTFFYKISGQNIIIQGEFIGHYKGTMKLGENNEKKEEFTFIFNKSSSYFVSNSNFQFENTGDFGIGSYFPERFIFNDNEYNISGKYVETMISYNEKVTFKWKIQNERKIIHGVNCQLATANKYGRTWAAYFAKEYPFPFGPAKFGGLPGLIFEVSDSEGEYKFVIEDLKKQNNSVKVNLSNYKQLSKQDYLKARNNSEFSIASFPGLPVSQSKEFEKRLEKLKKMNNNPLERKPFE